MGSSEGQETASLFHEGWAFHSSPVLPRGKRWVDGVDFKQISKNQ